MRILVKIGSFDGTAPMRRRVDGQYLVHPPHDWVTPSKHLTRHRGIKPHHSTTEQVLLTSTTLISSEAREPLALITTLISEESARSTKDRQTACTIQVSIGPENSWRKVQVQKNLFLSMWINEILKSAVIFARVAYLCSTLLNPSWRCMDAREAASLGAPDKAALNTAHLDMLPRCVQRGTLKES